MMGFLFAAYAVVWLVFFVYLLNLHKKQRTIWEEMSLLSKKLSQKGR